MFAIEVSDCAIGRIQLYVVLNCFDQMIELFGKERLRDQQHYWLQDIHFGQEKVIIGAIGELTQEEKGVVEVNGRHPYRCFGLTSSFDNAHDDCRSIDV